MLEFYNSYIRTARKAHKCEYCEKEIMVGEKYGYESGKFEGDFFTRKLCIPCRKMLDAYIDSVVKFKKVLIGVFLIHGLRQKRNLRLNGSVAFAALMVSQGPVGRQDVL